MRTHTLRWQPPSDSPVHKQGVYLLHGTGEHAARYEQLAVRLANAGFRVGAHDHPGHGMSDGSRGIIDIDGALVTQAAIQCERFTAETGCEPLIFGHSLGGVVATEMVLEHGVPAAGLILSAPAFALRLPKPHKVLVKLLARLAPRLALRQHYDPRGLTHDDDVKRQAKADPLIHGVRSAGLVDWLIRSGERQLGNADKLNVDTLVLIAGSDPVVDSSRTQQFAHEAPADKITTRIYEGYLHELLNETPDRSERVLTDIMRWTSDRFGKG